LFDAACIVPTLSLAVFTPRTMKKQINFSHPAKHSISAGLLSATLRAMNAQLTQKSGILGK